jgi:hypothetical protein
MLEGSLNPPPPPLFLPSVEASVGLCTVPGVRRCRPSWWPPPPPPPCVPEGSPPVPPRPCRNESVSGQRSLFTLNSVTSINSPHCPENQIYVFPEKELRGLSPNSYIHVSVSDLYIPRIGPQSTYLAAANQTDRSWKYINLSKIMSVGIWR